jgi:hypothetical protein
MTSLSKLMCGITLLTVPTIQYGGYFLLMILTGRSKLPLTDFQKSMFRAGHAHAGVLVILSLIAQLFIDSTHSSTAVEWMLRIGFPLAAILVSGGFFASASGNNVTTPNRSIMILYLGALVLAVSLVILGVALIQSR